MNLLTFGDITTMDNIPRLNISAIGSPLRDSQADPPSEEATCISCSCIYVRNSEGASDRLCGECTKSFLQVVT